MERNGGGFLETKASALNFMTFGQIDGSIGSLLSILQRKQNTFLKVKLNGSTNELQAVSNVSLYTRHCPVSLHVDIVYGMHHLIA